MPKVHIVTEDSWICRRLSNSLQNLDGFDVRVSTGKPTNADLTYYLTYLHREFYPPVGKSLALFTHFVPGQHQRRYDSISGQVNHCTVLSDQHYRYLGSRVGYHNVTRVNLPVMEDHGKRRLRIGWFHRSPPGYGSRKRTDLLDEIRKQDWIELRQSNGNWNSDQLKEEMKRAEVFLTTSDHESGPMSLLEGMALGKHVVIPTGVGLSDEYATLPLVHQFQPGDKGSLLDVLRRIYEPIKLSYDALALNTIKRWRIDHARIFKEVLTNG